MKRTAKGLLFFPLFLVLAAGLLIAVAQPSAAGSKVVSVEGAMYSVNNTMHENIARFKDKHIKVLVAGGQLITGKVVDVNASYLHLSSLENENFFDALIRMDQIVAVKAQFRKYE